MKLFFFCFATLCLLFAIKAFHERDWQTFGILCAGFVGLLAASFFA